MWPVLKIQRYPLKVKQPADEPEVPTTVQTPTTSSGKVTQDLNELSIDLDTNVTVIPETQVSQIPNAQSTSNDNVKNTIDETNIEDVVIVDDHADAHADGTAIQIEESSSPASSTGSSPTQDFSIGPGRYFSMHPFARMVPCKYQWEKILHDRSTGGG